MILEGTPLLTHQNATPVLSERRPSVCLLQVEAQDTLLDIVEVLCRQQEPVFLLLPADGELFNAPDHVVSLRHMLAEREWHFFTAFEGTGLLAQGSDPVEGFYGGAGQQRALKLPFSGPLNEAIFYLKPCEGRPSTQLCERIGARDNPGGRIGDAHREHFSRTNDIAEHLHQLFDEREKAPDMHEIRIGVIGPLPFQVLKGRFPQEAHQTGSMQGSHWNRFGRSRAPLENSR